MRITVQVLVFVHAITSVFSKDSCSSSKHLARYTEELGNLDAEDIVLEGKYVSENGGKYRFTVTHAWNINHGGMKDGNALYVNIGSDAEPELKSCFEELTLKEKYILLLRKSDAEVSFIAKLAPLSLRKRGHREQLWDVLCEIPTNDCSMTISRDILPSVIQLFPEMNSFLRCRVKSRSRLTEIRWLKDGVDIAEEGGEVYAANGVFVRGPSLRSGTSDLVVFDAHRMHSGSYSCVAKNVDGEMVEMKTRLAVGSLSEAFETCPASAADYCLHDAKCNAVRGFPKEIFCECKPGYHGARCGDSSVPDVGEVSSNEKALNKQVYELRIALIVVASAFIVSSLVCAIVVTAFVRMRRDKTSDTETEPSDTENTEISPLKGGSERDISFHEANKLTMSYEINGDSGSIRSQRQRFKSVNVSNRDHKSNGYNSPKV